MTVSNLWQFDQETSCCLNSRLDNAPSTEMIVFVHTLYVLSYVLCYLYLSDCGDGKVAADTSDCYLNFHKLRLHLQGDKE